METQIVRTVTFLAQYAQTNKKFYKKLTFKKQGLLSSEKANKLFNTPRRS